MSLSNVPLIKIRIKAATPQSPIAVFKIASTRCGYLDAVFGSTIPTHRRVQQGDPLFVGYFHNKMDLDEIHNALSVAAR